MILLISLLGMHHQAVALSLHFLLSGSSIAISQNAYVKAYNGLDVLTIMSTEKGIKSHVYTNVKELYEHSKFGEE